MDPGEFVLVLYIGLGPVMGSGLVGGLQGTCGKAGLVDILCWMGDCMSTRPCQYIA